MWKTETIQRCVLDRGTKLSVLKADAVLEQGVARLGKLLKRKQRMTRQRQQGAAAAESGTGSYLVRQVDHSVSCCPAAGLHSTLCWDPICVEL
jgi:hypothetical protein